MCQNFKAFMEFQRKKMGERIEGILDNQERERAILLFIEKESANLRKEFCRTICPVKCELVLWLK